MFWMRNEENSSPIHTIILRPVMITSIMCLAVTIQCSHKGAVICIVCLFPQFSQWFSVIYLNLLAFAVNSLIF